MADNSLAGKDLRDMDLRGKDLTDKVLFETAFNGAKLHGAKISLTCSTFSGAYFDNKQVSLLLLMLSLANIDQRFKDAIERAVKEVTGETGFAVLTRYLDIA